MSNFLSKYTDDELMRVKTDEKLRSRLMDDFRVYKKGIIKKSREYLENREFKKHDSLYDIVNDELSHRMEILQHYRNDNNTYRRETI